MSFDFKAYDQNKSKAYLLVKKLKEQSKYQNVNFEVVSKIEVIDGIAKHIITITERPIILITKTKSDLENEYFKTVTIDNISIEQI